MTKEVEKVIQKWEKMQLLASFVENFRTVITSSNSWLLIKQNIFAVW